MIKLSIIVSMLVCVAIIIIETTKEQQLGNDTAHVQMCTLVCRSLQLCNILKLLIYLIANQC